MTDSVGEPYSILAIQPEWVLEDEAMGSKQKFWFRESNDSPDWLFKFPQPNTGQHWAEKIAAEVAGCLDILHARVELAMFQDVQVRPRNPLHAKAANSFMGTRFSQKMLGYDSARKFRQSDHTLLNIFSALDQVFKSAEAARVAKERMAAYLVLDALVGNTDRHHENWGILRKRTPNGWAGMVAPSFDHASSLGPGTPR